MWQGGPPCYFIFKTQKVVGDVILFQLNSHWPTQVAQGNGRLLEWQLKSPTSLVNSQNMAPKRQSGFIALASSHLRSSSQLLMH
jgi:hypothetical protein